MHKKVVLIGGKGSCVDIAEEIEDARGRYGMDIEVLGFAFDDPAYRCGINDWPVLCGTHQAWSLYKDDPSVFLYLVCFAMILLKKGLRYGIVMVFPLNVF